MRRLLAGGILAVSIILDVMEEIFHPSRYNYKLDDARCALIGHDLDEPYTIQYGDRKDTVVQDCNRCYRSIPVA